MATVVASGARSGSARFGGKFRHVIEPERPRFSWATLLLADVDRNDLIGQHCFQPAAKSMAGKLSP
jgi:hypothetical protein